MDKKNDIFISHASEDKGVIVRPLAIILERLSIRVWYDEFSLQLGDSLIASIDKGLHESNLEWTFGHVKGARSLKHEETEISTGETSSIIIARHLFPAFGLCLSFLKYQDKARR